jgi:hypothetical protein
MMEGKLRKFNSQDAMVPDQRNIPLLVLGPPPLGSPSSFLPLQLGQAVTRRADGNDVNRPRGGLAGVGVGTMHPSEGAKSNDYMYEWNRRSFSPECRI